jgi:hypothetical protein
MDRQYDIFEKLPGGYVLWRETIVGRQESLSRLGVLATATRNEIYAIHLPTKEIIATLNKK